MAQGKKTGGRIAGTPNKRTAELVARLEGLGVDPLSGLAAIVRDSQASLELRARIHCELLAYLFPKRKALDVSAPQQPVSIRIGIPQQQNGRPPVAQEAAHIESTSE